MRMGVFNRHQPGARGLKILTPEGQRLRPSSEPDGDRIFGASRAGSEQGRRCGNVQSGCRHCQSHDGDLLDPYQKQGFCRRRFEVDVRDDLGVPVGIVYLEVAWVKSTTLRVAQLQPEGIVPDRNRIHGRVLHPQ